MRTYGRPPFGICGRAWYLWRVGSTRPCFHAPGPPPRVSALQEGNVVISETTHTQPGKASFDDVYDQPDPRPYYRTLRDIDYVLPGLAQPVFGALLAERREQQGAEDLVVADICCSYGVNAALMNHDVDLEDLFEHYSDPRLDGCTRDEILDADAQFYGERRVDAAAEVIGIDIAGQAVSYGVDAGLLAHGVDTNLEEESLGRDLRPVVADTDVVTITGGVGYVTHRTFSQILGAVETERKPWVVAFALRWVDYEPVADVLADAGLETEQVEGAVFRQRRFSDAAEREYALRELQERGIDPTDVEDTGWFHANLFVSRPSADVRGQSVSELLADAS